MPPPSAPGARASWALQLNLWPRASAYKYRTVRLVIDQAPEWGGVGNNHGVSNGLPGNVGK